VPSYIMVTASASVGGDYFTGHDGSKMWLDDLELVY
ncbi:MAG: PCMD domain-containing protein, partial [Muribaculaceae bacterium]|nr:PCMD domain-containing protein [Muribaculaceae bacterium]